jgi:hypothetical protein
MVTNRKEDFCGCIDKTDSDIEREIDLTSGYVLVPEIKGVD